jgi:broad specificity phosphatase PhoE
VEPRRRTLIYLLRHGEVEQAATRRFIGHLDVPLSAHGLRQCAAQGARLGGVALAGVFASDLQRARRSGELLGAPHGLTPTLLPALREMAMGRWEGLTADQIRAREPETFAHWMAHVDAFAFPDGESLTDLLGRAWPAFQGLVAAHAGQRIAVAAHGGTNRVLLCQALGLPLGRILALGQDYGALTVLEHADGRWRLRRLNEPPLL